MKLAAPCLAVFTVLAAGQALGQPALPEGASAAPNVTGPHAYAPETYPGSTAFDPADRLAIANLLYAYSFAYDNYEASAWLSLFTPDAEFYTGLPGGPSVVFKGDGFRAFWTKRMADFRSSGNQRRHLMSNILFLEQTEDTAHISVVGLLTNAKDGKTFTAVSSLNYEGWLVKDDDGWKIQRWYDYPDAAFGE